MIDKFIKSDQSNTFIKNDVQLFGAIYNNSSKPKTKWDDLINWQVEWKTKLKNGFQVYFDEPPKRSSMVTKRNFNKLKLVYKKKFQNFNAVVSPVMTNSTQLVVTSNMDQLSSTVAAISVIVDDLKIWDFNKVSKFFERLEINTKKLFDLEKDQVEEKSKEIIYFDKNPHVYLYDIMQNYRPLILKVWEQKHLNNLKTIDMPYPILIENSNYGRCPFDRRKDKIENNSYCIKKRYFRDELNRQYATNLKKLYCYHAKPQYDMNFDDDKIIHYEFNNSTNKFDKQEKLRLKRTNTNFKFMSFNETDRNSKFLNGFESNDSFALTNELVDLHNYSNDRSKGKKFLESNEEYYDNEDGKDNEDDRNETDSTQETLATDINSDDKNIFSLGDYEARTDIVDDILPSGYQTQQKLDNNNLSYCELCQETFESLNLHCNSKSHKFSFHNNKTHFSILDELINRLQ